MYILIVVLNPLPDFGLFQTERVADDNFKFDENGRKLSKWVENTVGKGEIAHYEQFLFFPQCFQKDCFPGASKGVFVWEWVNSLPNHTFLARGPNPKHLQTDGKLIVTKIMISVNDRVEISCEYVW